MVYDRRAVSTVRTLKQNNMNKQIPGFEQYWISENGEIFNKHGARVYGAIHSNGSMRVQLRKDNKTYSKYVHRLIADAYVPNPDNKKEVTLKDGDKKNIHYSNLQWSTRSECVKGKKHKKTAP